MNFKKIAITAAAGALILGSAVPAFAYGGYNYFGNRGGGEVSLEISNEDTRVTNNVETIANSGKNEVEGEDNNYRPFNFFGFGNNHESDNKGGYIRTGDAFASANVANDVNYNEVDLCGCLGDRRSGDVKVEVENEDTSVRNNVDTVANTGRNEVEGRGVIRTGGASAFGVVSNFVNTNIVGGSN